MTRYQFQIDDEKWDDWKMTVPRDKSLEKRIIELIEADTEGRVLNEDEQERLDALEDTFDEIVEAVKSGSGDEAREALERAQEAISDGDRDD